MPRLAPLALVLALCLAGTVTRPVQAAFQIDQNTIGSSPTAILTGTIFGQSFSPDFTLISQGSFFLSAPINRIQFFTISLRSGAGLGGTLLAETVGNNATTGLVEVGYSFDRRLTIAPGMTYTLSIRATDNSTFSLRGDSGNPYARGTAYGSSGAITGTDLGFIEGFETNPVPEPSSLVLLGLGLAGIGSARRLFRRSA